MQTPKAVAQILPYQYNTSLRYSNSVLGNHQSSVTNDSSQDCNLTFSLLQRQVGLVQSLMLQQRRVSVVKVITHFFTSYQVRADDPCRSVDHPDITSTPAPSKSPIGPIVGGVVGGVVVLLAAIIFGICIIRRTSRRKNSTEPSPLLMANHTHLRSQSDVMIPNNNMSTPNMSTPVGYTSLSSSPMRPSSPTIRTHASSSIRSFPFFSSGGSTVSPSVRQQSPPPVSMHRDETAVEPFRLPPTNNHNPDRKQANGAYPVYDPPTAPPTVRMEVRSSTPTQGGRTRYNPPAYSEQTKASPEAGGSRSPATVGQVHAKKGSADTQHSVTSGGSAPRVGGSNPARGNVVNHLTPPGSVKNPQINSHAAGASTSANAITEHRRQRTDSDTSRKRRPDTEDNFSVRDIA